MSDGSGQSYCQAAVDALHGGGGISVGTIAAIVLAVAVTILCFVLVLAQGPRARKTSTLTAPLVSDDSAVPATAVSDASPAAHRRSLVVVAAELASRLSGTAQTAAAPECRRTVESVLAAATLLDFVPALAEAGCLDADDIEAMPDAELRELGVILYGCVDLQVVWQKVAEVRAVLPAERCQRLSGG